MLPTDFKALYEHEKYNPWKERMPENDGNTKVGGRTRMGKSRMGGNYGMTTTRGGYGGDSMMDSSTQ